MLVQKSWGLGLFADISLNKDIRFLPRVQLWDIGICGSNWSINSHMPGDKAMPPHHLWTYSDELCPIVQIILIFFPSPLQQLHGVCQLSRGIWQWRMVSWPEGKGLGGNKE